VEFLDPETHPPTAFFFDDAEREVKPLLKRDGFKRFLGTISTTNISEKHVVERYAWGFLFGGIAGAIVGCFAASD
jgi:hypothetical protein